MPAGGADPVVVDAAGLTARIAALPGRAFVAIAGAPGSGKSTLVETLAQDLPGAMILPMDGFHYDDAVLRARDRLPFKGAPDTFDVGGLRSVLERLRGGEAEVAVPVFDRDLEISRGSARIIPAGDGPILVEGNYLLLDEAPWSALAPFFDLTVMIDVPEAELRRGLTARWEHYQLTPDQIAHKLDVVDLPNGRRIREGSRTPDLVLQQG